MCSNGLVTIRSGKFEAPAVDGALAEQIVRPCDDAAEAGDALGQKTQARDTNIPVGVRSKGMSDISTTPRDPS